MKNKALFSSLLFSLTVLATTLSSAAPFPRGVPSSQLEPEIGVYTNEEVGFTLQSQGTNWVLGEPPESSQGLEALFYAQEKNQDGRALLTIRVDKNTGASDVQTYMEKWGQEYPRYGFQVLGSRSFEINGQNGYVVDLVNREKSRQMRQVVYFKDQNAVILTCRDGLSTFETSLRSCNSIMRSFAWTQGTDKPPGARAPSQQEAPAN